MKKILMWVSATLFYWSSSLPAYSQGDTSQNRMLYSLLNDSTEFQYEIGQITLRHSGSPTYLKFVDSTSLVCDQFLRTKPFHITATGDSVYFRRFAHFDDKYAPMRSEDWITITSENQLDSILAARRSHYLTKEIYPSSTYFHDTSTIKYSVELRKVSDNTLLKILDTITVFKSDTGFLRWRAKCRQMNIRRVKLYPEAELDTPVYMAVTRQDKLPVGATLQNTGRGAYVQYPVNEGKMFKFQYQAFDTCGPALKAAPFSFNSQPLSMADITSLSMVNSISMGIATPHIESLYGGQVLVRILRSNGEVIYEQLQLLKPGSNIFSIDLSSKSSGAYILLVRDAKSTFSTKFIIAK